MTEVWVRNPEYCVKECLEVGMTKIVWDRGYLFSKTIDPKRFMDLYYAGQAYRTLVIDDEHAVELRPESTIDAPAAVYPSWSYGDEISILEELLENNVADDAALQDDRVPYGLRPVAGQEHRIVLTNLPPASTGLGRKFFRVIQELQSEYPEAIIHAHGLYGFRTMFGLGYASVDVEPRIIAKKGRITLPTGQEVTFEKAGEQPHWITLLGFQPHELSIPRNRCMYNIKSAEWAGQHFTENVRFKHKGKVEVDPDAKRTPKVQENKLIFTRHVKVNEGDKFLCDTCSLQQSCKYFRTGAICAVPDSDPQPLSNYFQTRDADTIISGLGTLLAAQTHRLEAGMKRESDNDDKLDPEVTKILNGVFDRGVVLAKLLNPALTKPTVQINHNTLNAGSPQQLMASIVDALEAQGIPRDKITPEMIEAVINEQQGLQQKAIEVASTERAAS